MSTYNCTKRIDVQNIVRYNVNTENSMSGGAIYVGC